MNGKILNKKWKALLENTAHILKYMVVQQLRGAGVMLLFFFSSICCFFLY